MTTRLRWDEDNLALNEEEKVPRMKIDEPDTPYHYETHEQEEEEEEVEVEHQQLHDKLGKVAHQQQQQLHKQEEFTKKRKLHYNEFQRAKELHLEDDE